MNTNIQFFMSKKKKESDYDSIAMLLIFIYGLAN